jgi:hypothetical protein
MRNLPSHSIENVIESMYCHEAHSGKKHTGNYYTPSHHHAGTRTATPSRRRRLSKVHGNAGHVPKEYGKDHSGKEHVGKEHGKEHGSGHNAPGGGGHGLHDAAMLSGHAPLGCKNELALDQHYYVYFYTPSSTTSTSTEEKQPTIIFAAVHDFPKPDWAQSQNEDELFVKWRLNKRYPTNYGYVKMTNWYAYYMLQLQLLDYFDYAGKLDNDVSFVKPFPKYNLPGLLARDNHWIPTSANGWYHDDPRISQGVELCITKYLEQESGYCSEIAMRLNGLVPAASASVAVDRYKTMLQQQSSPEELLKRYNTVSSLQGNLTK